jgi:hypothetical protein
LIPQKAWRPLFVILFWLAAAYFLAIPIIRPRGLYFWGHYRLIDVYFGIPSLVLALALTLTVFVAESKRRQLTFKLVALIASVFITIAVLDVAYAFIVNGGWKPAHTDAWFDPLFITKKDNLPDDELGFARKPRVEWQGRLSSNSKYLVYRTDENGFRNPLGITTADVVFIGDSFTEAGNTPEDETFVQQFHSQTKLSTANLGRGYYGPQQELIVLQRYAFKYHPRLVIWQVFEGNDLTDASRFAKWKASPGQKDSLALRYTKHSIIGGLLARTLANTLSTERMFEDQSGQLSRLYLDYQYLPDEPASESLGMSETRKTIEAAYNLCQSRGVKMLVIFIPIKVRVMGPYVRFNDANDRNFYLPDGKQDSNGDFGSEVAKLCSHLGCPFIDMTNALRRRAAEDNRKVYSTVQDTHLDTDGHTVVAQTLTEWIRTNLSR